MDEQGFVYTERLYLPYKCRLHGFIAWTNHKVQHKERVQQFLMQMYDNIFSRKKDKQIPVLYYLSTFQQEWNYFIVSHLQQFM